MENAGGADESQDSEPRRRLTGRSPAMCTRGVQATPAVGFVGLTVVKGTFADIDVFNHVVPPDFWKTLHRSDVWLSWQKTKGDSDLYIQNNTWQPGRPDRLAQPSGAQPDYHHEWDGDRLRKRRSATAGPTCTRRRRRSWIPAVTTWTSSATRRARSLPATPSSSFPPGQTGESTRRCRRTASPDG